MPTKVEPAALKAMTGQVVGKSDWIEVTQQRINEFAQATGDFQFIHLDPVAAAQTPFGGTIAHGFLTLSLIPLLTQESDIPRIAGIKMGVNYGGNKTRFLSPVRSGKRIRGSRRWKSPSRSKTRRSPR